jgi:hypothetical protein
MKPYPRKSNLVPDCDVHGSRMKKWTASTHNSLEEAQARDVEVWGCETSSCDRYFYENVGYQTFKGAVGTGEPSPTCERHGTRMVVQSCLSQYVCPVDGCEEQRQWPAPKG